MNKKFVYQQSIVQWRIPIKEDGTLGEPEIVNKFITEWKRAEFPVKKKTATLNVYKTEEIGEVFL